MKKSSSKSHYQSRQHLGLSSKNNKKNARNNKTTSTVVHTESEHHNQTTTKKNSYSNISQNQSNLQRANSCTRISSHEHPTKNIYSKANILKIQQNKSNRANLMSSNRKAANNKSTNTTQGYNGLQQKNQQLMRENIALREQCMSLHENQIKSKQKIQTLISRISEYKRNEDKVKQDGTAKLRQSKKSSSIKENSGVCNNQQCQAKKKKLEQEAYLNRIKVEELENERRKWEGSKENLKNQYRYLLEEVKKMRGE